MKYEEILDFLGPCGLNCRKCVFYSKGEIREHSMKLKELFGSFDNYAKRFSKLIDPVFNNYQKFKELLEFLTHADCKGCRNQTCAVYPDCGVVDCYKKKDVDFCFQCDEFPCEKTNFDLDLKRRWILMNNRAKEIGIDAYYKESMKFPRYRYKVGPE
jgi:hypothetical protein